jgi:hypothetical protein
VYAADAIRARWCSARGWSAGVGHAR